MIEGARTQNWRQTQGIAQPAHPAMQSMLPRCSEGLVPHPVTRSQVQRVVKATEIERYRVTDEPAVG